MAYTCIDCSYRGKMSGQGGQCPACGSYNISHGKEREEVKPKSKTGLIILVALWVYLLGHILWKLVT